MVGDPSWDKTMKWVNRFGMFIAALVVAFLILAFTASIVNTSARQVLNLHESTQEKRDCAVAQMIQLVLARQEILGAPLSNTMATQVRDWVKTACASGQVPI